ncbi:MAG: efflux RND transporter periplasmic adaptor subunit [Bacteroidota bacterium]|nr:efflux RND transporter periplasmic adaptor subunit [Bacteroidota bacterium]
MYSTKKITRNVLFASGFALLAACSGSEKTDAKDAGQEAAIPVIVGQPASGESSGFSISGEVASSQTANISTRVMGYITRLNVKVGDHVNKGQLIASISNNDILAKRAQVDAMIAEAEAAAKNAQKDFDRFTALYQQQSASAKELDNVTLQYNAAKARVESARQMRNEVNAQLSYTSLTAPFSGTVTQKLADAGSMASPGMTLVTIEQSGNYEINASVPESEINQLKQGIPVNVQIKSINRQFIGTLTQINPSSQFTGGQYLVKISVPEKEKAGLYAGMYANIDIPNTNKKTSATVPSAVLVPVASIIHKDQLTGLYTISDHQTALLRWVRLGKTYGDQVEVISGLSSNERFIVHADGNLYNGALVRIKN